MVIRAGKEIREDAQDQGRRLEHQGGPVAGGLPGGHDQGGQGQQAGGDLEERFEGIDHGEHGNNGQQLGHEQPLERPGEGGVFHGSTFLSADETLFRVRSAVDEDLSAAPAQMGGTVGVPEPGVPGSVQDDRPGGLDLLSGVKDGGQLLRPRREEETIALPGAQAALLHLLPAVGTDHDDTLLSVRSGWLLSPVQGEHIIVRAP